MPKIVPSKNIDPVFVDIKNPKADYGNFSGITSLNLAHIPQPPESRVSKRPFVLAGLIILAVFLTYSASVFFNLKKAQNAFAEKGGKVADNFSSAVENIKELTPKEASARLNENQKELENLNNLINNGYNQKLFGALGNILPIFKEAGGLLGNVIDFNLNFLKISEKLADLQANGFKYFQNNGDAFLNNLKDIQNLIRETITKIESVRNATANLKDATPFFDNFNGIINNQYIKYNSDLQLWDNALGGFVNLLGSENDIHFALLFQNPAEIRPGGGFIGSYADLVVNKGQMKNLDVNDIYWPDHPKNFNLKVIPPEPLQTITTDWGARDANWFFDFPTSAKTVLGFLESSKLYSEPNVKFEGAIGINIRVVETVLGITGPIEIPEYDMTIDKNNFLIKIQREVETGQDKKNGENPKKVLKVLTPLILEKLNNLPPETDAELFEKLKEHLDKKDIMIYLKNQNLANVLQKTNVDGAVYNLPNNFWGGYLAVVNANVAAGKSDAFIDETIEGKIDVDTDGGIFTDLNVIRTHNGNKEKDPWWRAENKNFIQIYANPGSSLISISGNSAKAKAQFNYAGLNYETNSDLEKIESASIFLNDFSTWAMNAFQKTVFATWFKVKAGETGILNIRYQLPGKEENRVAKDKVFQFVYERQSGVKAVLRLKIGAPLGYIWKESKSPIFEYADEDPKARVTLNLTLDK